MNDPGVVNQQDRTDHRRRDLLDTATEEVHGRGEILIRGDGLQDFMLEAEKPLL